MASWPATLPSSPSQSSFAHKISDGVIRTTVDELIQVERRRTDAIPVALDETYRMTQTQKTALDTFFQTTLAYGTVSFTYTSPITTNVETRRFLAPPSCQKVSSEYNVTISVEILP